VISSNKSQRDEEKNVILLAKNSGPGIILKVAYRLKVIET
jgi:hypothetical protein